MASVSCFASGVVHFLPSSLLAAVVDRPRSKLAVRSAHDGAGCARRKRLRAPRGILPTKLDFIVSSCVSLRVFYRSAIIESWVSRIVYQTSLTAGIVEGGFSVPAERQRSESSPLSDTLVPSARPPARPLYAVPQL